MRALITGGAIGNLIDRIINGFVVDLTPLEIVAVKVTAASELCLETEPEVDTTVGLPDDQLIDAPSRPFVVKLRFAVT